MDPIYFTATFTHAVLPPVVGCVLEAGKVFLQISGQSVCASVQCSAVWAQCVRVVCVCVCAMIMCTRNAE